MISTRAIRCPCGSIPACRWSGRWPSQSSSAPPASRRLLRPRRRAGPRLRP